MVSSAQDNKKNDSNKTTPKGSLREEGGGGNLGSPQKLKQKLKICFIII
jgi:hypothetical protein